MPGLPPFPVFHLRATIMTPCPAGPSGHAVLPKAARLALMATVALSLAGCMVGPDYKKPAIATPAKWSGTAAAGADVTDATPQLAAWWQRLGDPQLDALINEAVAGNLDVATAKAKVREARATYRQAGGTLAPSVSASASATRAANGGNVSDTGDITIAGPFNTLQAGFDASWEIDLFGANRRTIEAARYGADAADEELRATLVTLIGDVASNYVAARSYQARIALARRTAASQRETAALTRTKLEAGAASAMDVANATGLAASTEADIPTLETAYAESVHRLSILTGQAPGALNARMKAAKPIPAPRLPLAAGIPADIVSSRPDVRQAERQLAQSTARVGNAVANRYPSVSLTGAVSTSGVRIGDLARQSSVSWSFGPTVSVPVFEGGQLKAAVDIAAAQRDQYFLAYHAAVLTAMEDVDNAIVALGQERLRRGKLASAAGAYRDAARLSRALYQSGSTSFLDVLDAERSLYSAEDALIQSRAAIATDYVALNKALGGGWDGVIDASKPVVTDTRTWPKPEIGRIGPPEPASAIAPLPAETPARGKS